MPRLLLFAVGERVIIERDTNFVSIVNVIHGLRITRERAAQIAATASATGAAGPADGDPGVLVAPVAEFNWGAVSLWRREPGDEGRDFEQRLDILGPNGENFGGPVTPFDLEKGVHSIPINGKVFPFVRDGTYTIRVSVRGAKTEGEEAGEWSLAAEYPFDITFV